MSAHADELICPKCGTAIEVYMACPDCGHVMKETPTQREVSETSEKDSQPRPGLPAPSIPGLTGPLREVSVKLSELEECTEKEVSAKIGKPNKKENGEYWPCRKPGMSYARDAEGRKTEVALFGPVPIKIKAWEPYQEWTYRNIVKPEDKLNPQIWILYMMQKKGKDGRSSWTVVETFGYPVGAVF